MADNGVLVAEAVGTTFAPHNPYSLSLGCIVKIGNLPGRHRMLRFGAGLLIPLKSQPGSRPHRRAGPGATEGWEMVEAEEMVATGMAVVAAQAGPAVTRAEADWDSAEAGWGSAVEVEAHDWGSEAATRGEEGGATAVAEVALADAKATGRVSVERNPGSLFQSNRWRRRFPSHRPHNDRCLLMG